MRKINLINPVAKALFQSRPRKQVVLPRKGKKAKYNRKQEKERTNAKARSHNISED